ncbi:sodium:solute symporter family protein [Butyrivibrio sp. MB2005]|uniref:sodium:solute symporter family protein n=1 Tax=Butyrivibrio sp. MB2005 TaxID=1280678 RepID=UPI0003FF7525|nr:sodium:solute symporter family protein [Butyrivibrio sp. MB2005]
MVQLVIVIGYFLITFLTGILARKKTVNSKAFDGAGLGMLLCVMVGAGEWMGGTATTGVSEYGYIYGISGAWYTIANGIGICVLAAFFAKLFRSIEKPTVAGIIGNYIGQKARFVSACILIFVMVTVGTSQMIALGTLGQALFGFDPNISIIVLGCGVLIYTVLGGMVAVGYTNILHMIVMYAGIVLALVVSSNKVGGISNLVTSLDDSFFSMSSIGIPKVSSWVTASVLGACTAQAGLQPILAAKDEKTAISSSFLIALLVAPFGIFTALLGMISKTIYPNLENAKMALPTLLMNLSPLVGGLVMASIFAAILSTASPIFLSCGTLFSRDVYSYLKQNKTNEKLLDSQVLKVARISTALLGGGCIAISVLLRNASTILDIVYFAYSLRGCLFVILLFGIYWKQLHEEAAVIAMVFSGIVGLGWVSYKSIFHTYPIFPYFSETYATLLVAVISTVIINTIVNHNSKN